MDNVISHLTFVFTVAVVHMAYQVRELIAIIVMVCRVAAES